MTLIVPPPLSPFTLIAARYLAANFDSLDFVEDNAAKAIDGKNDRCQTIEHDKIIAAMMQLTDAGCTVKTAGTVADKDGKTGRRFFQLYGYDVADTCSFGAFDGRVAEVVTNCCDESEGSHLSASHT